MATRKKARNDVGSGELLTRREAAAFLGVAPQTLAIWRSADRYDLPVVKVGRLSKYRREDLERFLSRNTIEPRSYEDDGLEDQPPVAKKVRRNKKRKAEQSVEFAEVQLVSSPRSEVPALQPGASPLEVVLPSGIKLRFGTDCSLDLLSSVVTLLEKQ